MKSLALPFLAAALGLSACGQPADRKASDDRPPAVATTSTVEAVVLPRTQPVAGTVRPAERATLSARIMGNVTRAPAALGTRVTANEVLMELSAGEIQARLDQARANLDQVERELARENTLVTKGASSVESVRLLEDRRRAAAAAVDEATTFASYTSLRAPFAGVITRRFVEAGDLATAGVPLLEIEATDHLRAELAVPESLDLIAAGTELAIDLAGSDRALTGRLAEISPAADPATRTRLAKVDLPAGFSVRSGQFVRVLWPAGREEALLVPARAVTSFGQMEQVFVVEEGRARLRIVKTGGRQGDRVRILSGLTAGESVVVAPAATLRDGQRLEIRP
ncbi:MAG TPA: efflux RND transporter periplasmic adaptor subunit [Opitutaceae bacterium]